MFSENRAVYEIIWENRIHCCVPTATKVTRRRHNFTLCIRCLSSYSSL